jgi:hypothetical protein
MAYTIKDYLNSFRTKLADTISKQQIEPVKKQNKEILFFFGIFDFFKLRYDIDGRPYQIATGK